MTLQQLRYAVTIADNSSMNKASHVLYLSQSSLSGSIKDLESEIGFPIFKRTNRGIAITPEGKEFLGYARQVLEQYHLMENKYIHKQNSKKKFGVSMQHYCFVIKAFINVVQKFGMDSYEFAAHETKTNGVIEDVKLGESEIGILYLDDFNEKILMKIFNEYNLEFHEMFQSRTYVYLNKRNPLAKSKELSLEELSEYPFLSFDQGLKNSFCFSEEVLSTYEYQKVIKVNDRATMLNLMTGLNGYTLSAGLTCEDLNGDEFRVIPLKTEAIKKIGYIKKKDTIISELGSAYLTELKKYQGRLL
jgi:DNA-binding transcriptional LysR family regulator